MFENLWGKFFIIFCNACNDFFYQQPTYHYKYGCKKCGYKRKRIVNKHTLQSFIELANKKHDNKYDYSCVNYINGETKIEIICPIHGSFLQRPD